MTGAKVPRVSADRQKRFDEEVDRLLAPLREGRPFPAKRVPKKAVASTKPAKKSSSGGTG
jgi:hypothetical protein